GGSHHGELGLELRALIDVAGAEGVSLIGRGIGDVPVYAARRAVDDALTVQAAGGLEHVLRAAHVDFAVVAIGVSRCPENRCDVVNLLAAARSRNDVVEGRQLPDAYVDAICGKRPGFRFIPDECAHILALGSEAPSELSTGEARGAGDENGACH